MESERKRTGYGAGLMLIIAAVAIVALPWLLIAVAIIEQAVYGSGTVQELYRKVGIFEPLDWLVKIAKDLFS